MEYQRGMDPKPGMAAPNCQVCWKTYRKHQSRHFGSITPMAAADDWLDLGGSVAIAGANDLVCSP
jgi:hypothetical protein